MYIEEINRLFKKSNGSLNNNWKIKYEKLPQDYKDYIDTQYTEYSELSEKIKSILNGRYNRCPICDKIIPWSYQKTCSLKCSKNLAKQTNLERYGVECYLNTDEIREKNVIGVKKFNSDHEKVKAKQEKIQQTNLDRYGVECVFQHSEIRDKIKKTNIERYGHEFSVKNEDVKNKLKQTNLDRYGVECVFQHSEIRDKINKTNLERYGSVNPTSNRIVQEKMQQTNIERYGVSHPQKSKEIQEKTKQTNLEKYGVEYIAQHTDLKEVQKESKLITKQKYIFDLIGIDIPLDIINKIPISLNKKSYSKEYIQMLVDYVMNDKEIDIQMINDEHYSPSTKYGIFNKLDIGLEKQSSTYEKELCDWLDSLNINYETNVRNIIHPYELDIYISEHNLAIEFNGTYWHSDIYKDKYYHQNKTKICNEKDITLIHIHEYNYINSKEIYKSIIKSKLGLNERIYARKCILKEVSKSAEKDFLNKYHLQGFVGSSKCYGLYYKDELLTLCSFGKSRFNKKYEYELLRNCTKAGITVVGGLSKIIKHYKKEISNKEIICYSDASISYNKNSELTSPNYVWTKNNIILKRYNTMKHKLKKLLGDNFDNNLSESENMIKNSFYRVYDSGNYITIL